MDQILDKIIIKFSCLMSFLVVIKKIFICRDEQVSNWKFYTSEHASARVEIRACINNKVASTSWRKMFSGFRQVKIFLTYF